LQALPLLFLKRLIYSSEFDIAMADEAEGDRIALCRKAVAILRLEAASKDHEYAIALIDVIKAAKYPKAAFRRLPLPRWTVLELLSHLFPESKFPLVEDLFRGVIEL
jgi:hypothetical protein